MHCSKRIIAGDMIHQSNYRVSSTRNFRKTTTRAANANSTSERQKTINRRNAMNRAIYLIESNIHPGDLWCTFTYTDEHLPTDISGARTELSKFLRRLRKESGEMDIQYLANTEYGEKHNRLHHHMLIRNFEGLSNIIKTLWTMGGIDIKLIEKNSKSRNIHIIACYFSKCIGDKKIKSITHSKNLLQPQIIKSESYVPDFDSAINQLESYDTILLENHEGFNIQGDYYRNLTLLQINANYYDGNSAADKKITAENIAEFYPYPPTAEELKQYRMLRFLMPLKLIPHELHEKLKNETLPLLVRAALLCLFIIIIKPKCFVVAYKEIYKIYLQIAYEETKTVLSLFRCNPNFFINICMFLIVYFLSMMKCCHSRSSAHDFNNTFPSCLNRNHKFSWQYNLILIQCLISFSIYDILLL